jgi:hypothetical protein
LAEVEGYVNSKEMYSYEVLLSKLSGPPRDRGRDLALAGLARAQFIGRPNDATQYPIPPATRFGVLHIRPEGARLLPVVVDRATVAAFLDARRLFAWDQGPAKSVIGAPIERGATTVAA